MMFRMTVNASGTSGVLGHQQKNPVDFHTDIVTENVDALAEKVFQRTAGKVMIGTDRQ